MIGALREWLSSIVLVSVLLSVAQTLVPEGGIRRIASFTGGLILLITLFHPLLGTDLERLEFSVDFLQKEIEERQRELEKESRAELKELIERQTAAYISDKADALGISVQAQIHAETRPEGIPVPVSAELRGTYSEALSAYLERELGIPAERQVWHED